MNKTVSSLPIDCQGLVLVVDDEESNRSFLRNLLQAKGHQVIEATNGKEALEKAVKTPPDVVLLDVMMPGMDGYEVCRQMKTNPKTAYIPILLVTALSERSDRLIGIEGGANDFLSKPFDIQDLVLRVRNAVYSKHLFDQVEKSYTQLQKLEALRDNLTQMIIKDLTSPLIAMKAFLQLLQFRIKDKLNADEANSLDWVINLTNTLNLMIHSLLDISHFEAGMMPLNLSLSDLRAVVSEAVKILSFQDEQKRVVLELSPEAVWVSIDTEVIFRVVTNLVENALKFTPPDGKIKVTVKQEDARVWVTVTDTGPGIPPQYHEKIFEKFGQVEVREAGQKRSTGLGLTFCKLAVEAHSGKIMVESVEGKGSTFRLWLPNKKEEGGPEAQKSKD